MASILAQLEAALIESIKAATEEMQVQMVIESSEIIDNFSWDWKGRYKGTRSIVETGALRDSLTFTDVNLDENQISYSLTWNPTDPETGAQYASLVHDGAREYFKMKDGTMREYTARPWTFLLTPPEQRDDSQLQTKSGPTAESLPDDYWEACLHSFNVTLKSQLTKKLKVVA